MGEVGGRAYRLRRGQQTMTEARAVGDERSSTGAGNALNVPAGYRRTEAGVIPKDWGDRAIGDLFAFKNGLNKAKRYFGAGTPIVNYMDVFERPGLTPGDLSGRVSLTPDEIKNYQVLKGDVLFTRTSETAEEVGVASVMLGSPCDTVFSGFVLRARPRDGRLENSYKQFCFAARSVRSQIVSRATYTTRALTNGRSLSAVRIAVPPKIEQRAIAAVLSDVDELIGSLEALIAKKRAIKQAAMQELLTARTRLPGFGGEWEMRRVSGFGEVVTGGTPHTGTDAYWRGPYPWITPTDISSGRDMTTSERTITKEGLAAIRRLPADTVLVTCIASIGKNAILRTTGSCNQQINAIIPNATRYSSEFLYYLFEFNARYLLTKAGTTATSIVSKKTLSRLRFDTPAIEEQRAIATILSDMDAEIAALERRLDKTREIKQGMMQQLLTGSIRLPIPDDDREEDDAHDA